MFIKKAITRARSPVQEMVNAFRPDLEIEGKDSTLQFAVRTRKNVASPATQSRSYGAIRECRAIHTQKLYNARVAPYQRFFAEISPELLKGLILAKTENFQSNLNFIRKYAQLGIQSSEKTMYESVDGVKMKERTCCEAIRDWGVGSSRENGFATACQVKISAEAAVGTPSTGKPNGDVN
ncbi:hypothetical protein K438DRAFT_1782916 [Mycena galopus ATCC 62051]|nr:hypothetical protein K438DRAFT_1782916 [Mycena galopus ATCC 62051]